jgi:hypothetical protein
MNVKFPNVEVRLSGEEANAYNIIGKVSKALRRAGATQAQIDEFETDAKSDDYDHLLQTAMRWVEVS